MSPLRHRFPAAGVAVLVAVGTLAPGAHAAPEAATQVVAISPSDTQAQILAKAATVTPSARQLAWQREELTGFIHFGPNTYTGRDLGLGTEDPNIIQPGALDTDQWARTFKDAGFTKVILTAKHHDGMLLFQSDHSDYGLARSSWRGGQGDIVKDFTDSARALGIKVGLYLSPSDLHENQPGGRFGNGSAAVSSVIPTPVPGTPQPPTTFTFTADDYNRYYMSTLHELLTKYGTVDEVWFDGYDPTGGRQPYNFKDWYTIVRTLQPSATIFGGPDVRWVGNENGIARTSEWSVIPNVGAADPDGRRQPTFGVEAADIAGDSKLTTASNYLAWYPAECDARLGPTWFWHPNQTVKSLDALVSMYYASVGRNCQLLLNIGPDQTGRVDAANATRLGEFGARIRSMFATNLAAGASAANDAGTANTDGNVPANLLDADDATAWQPTATTGGVVVGLGAAKTFTTVLLQENIQVGQRVSGFAVDVWTGSVWQQVGTATTIGYKRLLQLGTPVTTDRVRLRITSARALPPAIATLRLYDDGSGANLAVGRVATQSSTSNTAPASRAVDGGTSGDFFAGSVTHTNSEPSPWWQVDLGAAKAVGSIAVWNRTDCCASRLSDYWVFASETPFDPALTPAQQAALPGVWSSRQTAQAGTPTRLTVGRTARYVMVRLAGTNPLSLAEVQVFSPADDFSLAASQPMTAVPAGQATTSTITTAVTRGSAATIALSATGLPQGATATFTPQTITAGGTATLTIQTSPTTPLGDSIVNVVGTTPESTRSAQVTISVVAAQPSPVVSGRAYQIVSAGKSVDVPGGSTTLGTQLIQWTTHGGANQRWTFTANTDGTYQIRNAATGLCADATTNTGNPVVQWTCHGGTNQRWSIRQDGTGWRLVAASSGHVLTATSTSSGAGLVQAPATGAATQRWTFPAA